MSAWLPVSVRAVPEPGRTILVGRRIGKIWLWEERPSVTKAYWRDEICASPRATDGPKFTHWAYVPDWLNDGPEEPPPKAAKRRKP